MNILQDSLGRRFSYLRISLTPVCNFRCSYCLPDGFDKKAHDINLLSADEIVRAVRAFSELGVFKVRFSGGEPTVRKGYAEIISKIAGLAGIETVGITTNGYKLDTQLPEIVSAGVNLLNVSVDSLDPEKFHSITGHNRLAEVLRGIKLALSIPGLKVKTNTVLLKGINDNEIIDFIEWTRQHPLDVRFIELMETADMLGEHRDFFRKHHIEAAVVEELLLRDGWKQLPRNPGAGPARIYAHPDYRGKVGIISPYSKDFCKSCNRLRLSSAGNLHLCLFPSKAYPLRELLQSDRQREELKSFILQAVLEKESSHHLLENNPGIIPALSVIGG